MALYSIPSKFVPLPLPPPYHMVMLKQDRIKPGCKAYFDYLEILLKKKIIAYARNSKVLDD